jgi:betaine-aldehyde dehydrogenase
MNLADNLFIGGHWEAPAKGGKFDVFKPTTGEVLCQCAAATDVDVDKAVKAAKACLYSKDWGFASTGEQRAQVLDRLGKLFTDKKDYLAGLDSLDNGKPVREAEADVDDAISACSHFADLARKQDADQDEKIEIGDADFSSRVRHEPIGVVGAITPWNYPLLMAVSVLFTESDSLFF